MSYLPRPSSKSCVQYIHFYRLDDGLIMEASNIQFEFIFLLFGELIYFLSEIQPNYPRNMWIT
jgi:hypothetical protein